MVLIKLDNIFDKYVLKFMHHLCWHLWNSHLNSSSPYWIWVSSLVSLCRIRTPDTQPLLLPSSDYDINARLGKEENGWLSHIGSIIVTEVNPSTIEEAYTSWEPLVHLLRFSFFFIFPLLSSSNKLLPVLWCSPSHLHVLCQQLVIWVISYPNTCYILDSHFS